MIKLFCLSTLTSRYPTTNYRNRNTSGYIAKQLTLSLFPAFIIWNLNAAVSAAPWLAHTIFRATNRVAAVSPVHQKFHLNAAIGVASTKNDNALTWPTIQFRIKNSCTIPVYVRSVFLLNTQNWTVHFIYWGNIGRVFRVHNKSTYLQIYVSACTSHLRFIAYL